MRCIKEKCIYFNKDKNTCKLKKDENGFELYTSKAHNCIADNGINLLKPKQESGK